MSSFSDKRVLGQSIQQSVSQKSHCTSVGATTHSGRKDPNQNITLFTNRSQTWKQEISQKHKQSSIIRTALPRKEDQNTQDYVTSTTIITSESPNYMDLSISGNQYIDMIKNQATPIDEGDTTSIQQEKALIKQAIPTEVGWTKGSNKRKQQSYLANKDKKSSHSKLTTYWRQKLEKLDLLRLNG